MTTLQTDSRIDFRINAENKGLIAKAAELMGLNLTSFAIATLVSEAQKVVDQHAAIRMSDRDRDSFLHLMENPPAPNARLLRAAKRHRESVVE